MLYSRELSEALRDSEIGPLDFREAAAKYGQVLGGMAELRLFWGGTPIEIVLNLLLEDEERPVAAPGVAVRRNIGLCTKYKICGVWVRPDKDRFFATRLLFAEGFVPFTHPRFEQLREAHFRRLAAHLLGLINKFRTDLDWFIESAQNRLKRFHGSTYLAPGLLPKQLVEGKGALV